MQIQDLSFAFDATDNHPFFNHLSISFTPNTMHFIQGDNGIGKSTLFNILQGSISSTALCSATITLDGVTYQTEKNRLPYALLKHIHTVQQQYDRMLAPHLSFIENLKLANLPDYPGLRSLPQATLFSQIQVDHIDQTKPVHLLSGGQRQLLAILMALQKPTKVLLLDEPTATLDRKNTHLIMQSLHQLATQLGVTMLIICHDKEIVQEYADGNSVTMSCTSNGERVLVRDL